MKAAPQEPYMDGAEGTAGAPTVKPAAEGAAPVAAGWAGEALGQLKQALWGDVLTPDDGLVFEEALATWSISPFRGGPPALVVKARGTQDVVEAVKFARAQGLKLAARSGGHGAGNPSRVEGGLMIDLSGMHSCHVDPRARTATIDGGCLLGDIDRATAVYGLAVPLGTAPVTGMGLVVNGGYGLLSRKYGATCENILELQVVTADGTVLDINEDSDPELLWAARGAASTLGIVTQIKLRLHDVSGAYTGILVYPDDPQHATYKSIVRWMRDVGTLSPDLGFVMLRSVDPHKGPTMVCMVVHLGPEGREEKEAFFKPLREFGPVEDTLGRFTYAQTQAAMLPAVRGLKAMVPQHYEYWTGGSIPEANMTEDVLDKLVHCLTDGIPFPECALTGTAVELLGGVLSDSDCPYGYKGGLDWVIMCGWVDPAHHELGVGYAKQVKATLGPLSELEPYVNFSDFSAAEALDSQQAAGKVGGPANLERLRAAKAKVDPDGIFFSTPFRKVLEA